MSGKSEKNDKEEFFYYDPAQFYASRKAAVIAEINEYECEQKYKCEYNCGYKYRCGYEEKCDDIWDCDFEWICK